MLLKKIIVQTFLMLNFGLLCQAQTTRYFEFTTTCGHNNWQDTTFVASATNQALIDTVLANLQRPLEERKFINGPIAHGHAGHNHNAHHWFLWHFIPDQWDLVEMAIEVCDGCPYSDVDADTAYWIGNIKQFCPWSGQPVREVPNPSSVKKINLVDEVSVYPNPSRDLLQVKWKGTSTLSVDLCNALGQKLNTQTISQENNTLDLSHYPEGVYFLMLADGNRTGVKKIVVNRN